jgi:hypothetical protein
MVEKRVKQDAPHIKALSVPFKSADFGPSP